MKRSLMVFAAISAFVLPALAPVATLAQDRGGDRGLDDRARSPQRDGRSGPRPQTNGDAQPDRGGRGNGGDRGGARPDRPQQPSQPTPQPQPDRSGGNEGRDRGNQPDRGGPDRGGNDSNRPGQDRPGQGRPDQNRPGQDRPGNGNGGWNGGNSSNRPGQGRPDQNRPGQDRPGQDRPGNGNGGWNGGNGSNRPGAGNGPNRPGNDWNNGGDRNRDRDRQRNEFRNRFDSSRWQQNWNRNNRADWWRSDRRFNGWSGARNGFYFAPGYGYYSVPRSYYGRQYSAGDFLPSIFWRYSVNDYRTYGLGYPPEGTRWVYVDNAIYLIDQYDGYIIDVIRNAWRW